MLADLYIEAARGFYAVAVILVAYLIACGISALIDWQLNRQAARRAQADAKCESMDPVAPQPLHVRYPESS